MRLGAGLTRSRSGFSLRQETLQLVSPQRVGELATSDPAAIPFQCDANNARRQAAHLSGVGCQLNEQPRFQLKLLSQDQRDSTLGNVPDSPEPARGIRCPGYRPIRSVPVARQADKGAAFALRDR